MSPQESVKKTADIAMSVIAAAEIEAHADTQRHEQTANHTKADNNPSQRQAQQGTKDLSPVRLEFFPKVLQAEHILYCTRARAGLTVPKTSTSILAGSTPTVSAI